jgi:hypothetical protein
MRFLTFLAVFALLSALAVSGCASRGSVAEKAPRSEPVAKSTAPQAKNNRFAMTQNGRKMSADDFDAWMKARGIRIAKGKPSAKAPKPDAKARPKTAAKSKP